MGRPRSTSGAILSAWDATVSFKLIFPCLSPMLNVVHAPRYLQNGNILAARTFIIHFVSQLTSRRPSLLSSLQPTPIPVGKPSEGEQDEIIFTTESAVNFAQLAVRACQRAQGDKNKAMREAWVRLCGTYQSRGGLVANREVRKVSARFLLSFLNPSASAVAIPPLLFARSPCILLREDRHEASGQCASSIARFI